jgi:uncharacterized protein (TIGR02466 family)
MIKNLFTVPVLQQKLDLDLSSIKNYCLSLKKKEKEGRVRSNKGGWQSENLIGEHPVLDGLVLNILNYGNNFSKILKIKNKLLLDNIWININTYNNVNIPHIHPGSILSGVFYVNVPKDSGNIRFQRPDYNLAGCVWPENLFETMNEENSLEWWMPSIENYLYLFPSWLSHWVEPNLNKKEERISISFNLA